MVERARARTLPERDGLPPNNLLLGLGPHGSPARHDAAAVDVGTSCWGAWGTAAPAQQGGHISLGGLGCLGRLAGGAGGVARSEVRRGQG